MKTAGLAIPPGAHGGNRVTALRWARFLRQLGWHVFREEGWSGRHCDLLIALHARHSAELVDRFRRECPAGKLVVAGTGTDLYVDLTRAGPGKDAALGTLARADRIVVLQERALDALPPELRERGRVIEQSLSRPSAPVEPDPTRFGALVLAHVRPVKDPLLAARAARLAPERSQLEVQLVGGTIDAELAALVRRESQDNPRFQWLGAQPRREALCTLASARLLVSTSLAEGGANVITEALALDVPVLATRIAGSVGILGDGYPGLFEAGDAEGLAALLWRAESDPVFYAELRGACRAKAGLAAPERELAAWRSLTGELFPGGAPA